MFEGQCPNCAGELVDGLCKCQHDGNRADCGCEYCSTPPTADMPAVADTQYRSWLSGEPWTGPDLWDGNG